MAALCLLYKERVASCCKRQSSPEILQYLTETSSRPLFFYQQVSMRFTKEIQTGGLLM